jgi:diguanylate cyclase (GGDEF)-like protein
MLSQSHLRPADTRRSPAPFPVPARQAMPAVDECWDDIMGKMDMAFQPIVNIHTGACFGYEALLRGHQNAGFDAIHDVFDVAYSLGVLAQVDLRVRKMAIAKFARLDNRDQAKVFINIDNRTLSKSAELNRATRTILDTHRIAPSAVVFEISERHSVGSNAEAIAAFEVLRRGEFRLAIDDFGTGFSGLQMLYFAEPDILKIDRFFISDIAGNSKKKLFLAQIVNIAHLLGVAVLAEGVETEAEYFVCKEIGCDLIQGYLVQRPTTDLAELRPSYEAIAALSHRDRRSPESDHRLIVAQIDPMAPLSMDCTMDTVFDRFRGDKAHNFFPVVDGNGEPMGIVRERELKEYAYSRYGQDLISNKTCGRSLRNFLVRCPVADINAKAENILQIYTAAPSADGIIIVDGMKYAGFLSADSLLRVINEKNLTAARDQNPLTKLPGNNAIYDYVCGALADTETEYALVYFDFDNFKPFNDAYGFRLGDRAILLFAELMAKHLPRDGHFAGHVGGDDFFLGFHATPFDQCEAETRTLVTRFALEVESFYDEETCRRGFMQGIDRAGNACRFPLLSVSAAVLSLPQGRKLHTLDSISQVMADVKKKAKTAVDRVSVVAI